jgi:hypothetical protein
MSVLTFSTLPERRRQHYTYERVSERVIEIRFIGYVQPGAAVGQGRAALVQAA